MAATHVSVLKLLSGGDVCEWFQKFVSGFRSLKFANGWDGEMKAKKLLTLLEGEVLAV